MPARAHSLWLGPVLILAAQAGFEPAGRPADSSPTNEAYVRVSPRDPRYFELSDGRPYLPIGLNMIAPPSSDSLAGMETWMTQLAGQGGNFIRVWLGHAFFDVEHQESGVYDEDKARRIDQMLQLAAHHGIRVKICLESFRHLGTRDQAWSAKPLHLATQGGPARDIADFFDGEASRRQFKAKLAWYARRYGSRPEVFGWELWNEINAVAGGDYMAWTEVMLPELHRLFPGNLCLQSLGSFDTDQVRELNQRLALLPGNDVAQVHRYLDLGARLPVCHGPVDVLAADAVRELLAVNPKRPVLLAESGAVEPRHTGPFKLYQQDQAGHILHDVLFAPFFAGAAGPGHIWHWDHYVARNNLWHHFGRFAAAVSEVDYPAEAFEPGLIHHPRLRIYALRGKTIWLMWCRDTQNTWESELAEGKPPGTIRDLTLEVNPPPPPSLRQRIRAFDPWQNQWRPLQLNDTRLSLPPFRRSLVIRFESGDA